MINPPTPEEIRSAIEEALSASGVDSEAVDIIEDEHQIPQVSPIHLGTTRVFPVHIAVVKHSGMLLFYAASGPAGIHARVKANREKKH